MKKFVFKTLKIMLLFLVFLYAIGLLIEYRLYRNTRDVYYSYQASWHLYHRQRMQVLFIGNSRTGTHIDAPRFVKQYGVPMYTLKQTARGLTFLWHMFKKFTERNKLPSVIVLQTDPTILLNNSPNRNTFFDKEGYLSYLFFDNLGISQYLKHEAGFHWYETFIPLIRYIPYPTFFKTHWKKQCVDPYGYPGLYGTSLLPAVAGAKLLPLDIEGENLNDTIDFTYLDSFAQYCSKNGIRLVCVYPPQSWISFNAMNVNYEKQIKHHAEQLKVPYHNFSTPEFAADSLFKNHLHLNTIGVKYYNNALMDYLDSLGFKQWIKPEDVIKKE